jgi:hypothetical protein
MPTPSLARACRLTLVVLAVLVTAAAMAAPVKFFVSGYVQGRISDRIGDQGTPANSYFDIKRASIYMRASVNEHVTGVLFVSGTPNARIEHAYAEYADKPYSARLGLAPVPFGYEAPISSSGLLTLERSQIITDLFIVPGVLLLDRGLYGFYMPGEGFNASLGIVNGTPVNDLTVPEKSGKVIVARLGHSISGGQIGASIYDGRREETVGNAAVIADATILGLDLQMKRGPWTILSELVDGEDNNIDKWGGYVTVGYRREGSPSQPYLRLDYEDQNENAGNDVFRRATVGYHYYLTPTSKLTAEYEAIDAKPGFSPAQPEGRITGQYQIIY